MQKILAKLRLHRRFPALLPIMNTGRNKPSFFIIGFQKCGTTTLYDTLVDHPKVDAGLLKENNLLSFKNWDIQEYLFHFPFKKKGKITGDASHLNTYSPFAPERIKEYFPDAKLLAIMRNPIDRAYSHFNMDQKIGYIPKSLSFEKYIELELILRKDLDTFSVESIYEGMRVFGSRYGWALTRGDYELFLRPYKALGMDVFPLFLEDFKSDQQAVMNEVYDHIGIPRVQKNSKASNQGKYTKPMTEACKSILEEFYRGPNQRLSTLLNRKLPW